MNAPTRRMPRRLSGLMATTVVAAALLAPAAAQAEPVDTPCQVERSERTTAIAALRAAREVKRAAATARTDARAAFKADRTRRNQRLLVAARTRFVKAMADRAEVRSAFDDARSSLIECLATIPPVVPPVVPPVEAASVAVVNPRVEFYGSNFAVADITWSHVPDGDYHYFNRYDDTASYWGPVSFAEVPPEQVYDPLDPFPDYTWYLQNGVTNTAMYLGGGCDYTPGTNVTVELWTGTDGVNPAGTKVASATVDNPCR